MTAPGAVVGDSDLWQARLGHLRVVRERWIVDAGSEVKNVPAKVAGRSATLDIAPHIDLREGMNDPEVTMLDALPNINLIASSKAIEAVVPDPVSDPVDIREFASAFGYSGLVVDGA